MLNIVFGGLHSPKTQVLYEKIKEDIKNGREVLVITPDQFSFESDKRLYNFLGARDFNKIETSGLNRLPEIVSAKYGQSLGNVVDDMTAAVEMYKAVREFSSVSDGLFYSKAFSRASFADDILLTVNQFISSSVSPEELELAAEQTPEGQLKDKLFDISNIYKRYIKNLEEDSLAVGETVLNTAAQIIDSYGFFKNKEVYIDEFNRFTLSQKKIVELAIRDASNLSVSITLNTQNSCRLGFTPFSESLKTREYLASAARALGSEVNFVDVSAKSVKKRPQALEFIARNLYSRVRQTAQSGNAVQIIRCRDKYSECVCACMKAVQLVKNEGFKWNETAFVARDLESYKSELSAAASRFEIPVFFDMAQSADYSALTMYVLSVLDMVSPCRGGGFDTQKVLRTAKSYLSDISDSDAFELESFCTKWGVNKKVWLSDFDPPSALDKNSKNYEEKLKEYNQYIENLNSVRRRLIEPAVEFRRKCKGSSNAAANAKQITSAQITSALLELLDEYNLPARFTLTADKCALSQDKQLVETARQLGQLWEIFSRCLICIHDRMDGEHISLAQYARLVKLVMSKGKIAQPPQLIDSAICADAAHSRLSSVRAVFVLGMNEGVFPAAVSSSGLLSDLEKTALEEVSVLKSQGKALEQNTPRLAAAERTNVYYALCAASERLFCTYSQVASSGDKLCASPVVSQLKSFFSDNIETDIGSISDFEYCTSFKPAYMRYIERMDLSGKNRDIKAIKNALETSEVYKEKIKSIERLCEYRKSGKIKISKETAKKLFFRKGEVFSASRAEGFFTCPFKYFCRYGLGLSTQSNMDINPLTRGSIVHYCLEKALSSDKKFDEEFLNLTDEQLAEKVSQSAREYKEQTMGGDFSKTARFNFLYSKAAASAWAVVKDIQNEFKDPNCSFKPSDFEYRLVNENGQSRLNIKIDGVTIRLSGVIDRVDKAFHDGKTYLRIVDYKTGVKEIDLNDVYYGLNLQMLIYMLATVCDSSGFFDENIVPSAVLYMPAGSPPCDIEDAGGMISAQGEELEKRLEEHTKEFYKRSGLIVNFEPSGDEELDRYNSRIFEDMAKRLKTCKPSEPIKSVRHFYALLKFVRSKIEQMGRELLDGEISPKITYNEYRPCDNCEYTAICSGKPFEETKVDKRKKVWTEIFDGEGDAE